MARVEEAGGYGRMDIFRAVRPVRPRCFGLCQEVRASVPATRSGPDRRLFVAPATTRRRAGMKMFTAAALMGFSPSGGDPGAVNLSASFSSQSRPRSFTNVPPGAGPQLPEGTRPLVPRPHPGRRSRHRRRDPPKHPAPDGVSRRAAEAPFRPEVPPIAATRATPRSPSPIAPSTRRRVGEGAKPSRPSMPMTRWRPPPRRTTPSPRGDALHAAPIRPSRAGGGASYTC